MPVVVVIWHHHAIVLFKSPAEWVEIRLATACRAIPCGEWGRQRFSVACSRLRGSRVCGIEKARTVKMKREETFSRSAPYSRAFHFLTIYVPAFLDTGLPRGNVHEGDSGPMWGAIPFPIPQTVKVGHTTRVYDPYSFRIVMWGLLRPTTTNQWKCCETGPTVFRPYARRLESLTICRCHYKGSTFFSVI